MANDQPSVWSKIMQVGVYGGIFAGLIAITGNIFLEIKRVESEAHLQVIQAQREFLIDIHSLNEVFRAQMATLALDNSPPLDNTLLEEILSNLRLQDQRISTLSSIGFDAEGDTVTSYRNNLLSIRELIIRSNDPGDLNEVWPLIASMVDDLDHLGSMFGDSTRS